MVFYVYYERTDFNLGLFDISRDFLEDLMQKAKRLGDILVESKAITQEQLMFALQKQKNMDKKLAEILVLEGI